MSKNCVFSDLRLRLTAQTTLLAKLPLPREHVHIHIAAMFRGCSHFWLTSAGDYNFRKKNNSCVALPVLRDPRRSAWNLLRLCSSTSRPEAPRVCLTFTQILMPHFKRWQPSAGRRGLWTAAWRRLYWPGRVNSARSEGIIPRCMFLF